MHLHTYLNYQTYLIKPIKNILSEIFLTALCTPIMTNFTLIDGGFWSPLFNKQTNNPAPLQLLHSGYRLSRQCLSQRSVLHELHPFSQLHSSVWRHFCTPCCNNGAKKFVKSPHLKFYILKSQIKPKADWHAVDSPKKRTNNLFFVLLFYSTWQKKIVRSFVGRI